MRPKDRTALEWLGQDHAWQAAARHGQRLLALQRVVDEAAPGLRLRVVSLQDGCLLLAAPHAATAAKLRQLAPTLKARLAKAGWEVEKFRLRAHQTPPERPLPRRVKDDIPPEGVRALREAGAQAPAGPLRDALERIARRHRDDPA